MKPERIIANDVQPRYLTQMRLSIRPCTKLSHVWVTSLSSRCLGLAFLFSTKQAPSLYSAFRQCVEQVLYQIDVLRPSASRDCRSGHTGHGFNLEEVFEMRVLKSVLFDSLFISSSATRIRSPTIA